LLRHCGDTGKPIYYVAEQEDATEFETLRMKRLLLNPLDPDANKFFAVLAEYKSPASKWPSGRYGYAVTQVT
jgi:hypothetical protein